MDYCFVCKGLIIFRAKTNTFRIWQVVLLVFDTMNLLLNRFWFNSEIKWGGGERKHTLHSSFTFPSMSLFVKFLFLYFFAGEVSTVFIVLEPESIAIASNGTIFVSSFMNILVASKQGPPSCYLPNSPSPILHKKRTKQNLFSWRKYFWTWCKS